MQRPATGLLATLAGVTFLAHMLVAGNYGYFRDELYYIADGRHLQAGYVDQPLLMGWLAALLRDIADDNLVAIHLIPALACALIIVVTGLMARELGGGRVAQLVAGVAALFTVAFMATASIFSMDVLDELWWALASLILLRLLRRNAPHLWLVIGAVLCIALLTKLTVLFFCLALALALLVTPERRFLLTPWPWLAAAIAFVGLLPYIIWNALNGWPTVEFWHHYGGVGTSPLDFLATQLILINPIAVPLAVAGLVFYFRPTGTRYRLLGWTFVFLYLLLTLFAPQGLLPRPCLSPPIRSRCGDVRAAALAAIIRLATARLCRPSRPGRHFAGAGCHADPAAGRGRALGPRLLIPGACRPVWLGQPHTHRGAGLCRFAAYAACAGLCPHQQLWRGRRAPAAFPARSFTAGY